MDFDRQTDRQNSLVFFLSTAMSQAEEGCPFHLCKVSGPLRRLLGHTRQSHDSDSLPREFVDRLNLLRCPHCSLWFLKLGQHTSQCRKRPKSTSVVLRSHQEAESRYENIDVTAPLPTDQESKNEASVSFSESILEEGCHKDPESGVHAELVT